MKKILNIISAVVLIYLNMVMLFGMAYSGGKLSDLLDLEMLPFTTFWFISLVILFFNIKFLFLSPAAKEIDGNSDRMRRVEIFTCKTSILGIIIMAVMIGYFSATEIFNPNLSIGGKGLALGSAVTCAIILFLGLSKIFSRKPALIIDEKGITYLKPIGFFNNIGLPSKVLPLFVEWSDIVKVSDISAPGRYRNPSIFIWIKEPERYLASQESSIQKLLKREINDIGTPIVIYTDSLKGGHKNTMNLITRKLADVKKLS